MRRTRHLLLLAAAGLLSGIATGQTCWNESPSLKPAPNSWGGDSGAQVGAYAGSAVTAYGAAYGASRVIGSVYPTVAGNAHLGHVGGVSGYGVIPSSIPVIGTAAASVPIVPTTLGQVPILGGVVQSVPVVGGYIAGPPHPVAVAATAVDTYYLPKMTPGGYTESSMFTMSDFNSPPRLRHYKNYLAPLPYTHPPIYAPATGDAALSEEVVQQAAEKLGVTGTVDIPN